nr:DUF6796 family protein [uncultured Blautia sp.]
MTHFQLILFFIFAIVGHILCGLSDCLLTYAPNGKVDLVNIKDYEKSSKAFEGMPVKKLSQAILLGVIAMTLEIFGYLALCSWMKDYSDVYYWIMYAAVLVMFTSLSLHHAICCIVEWFFVRLDRTRSALNAVLDFFKATAYTMYVGYLAMIVFAVAFFIAVVTGTTSLPAWACIFNLLPIAVIILPTKLPAKANVIGALMFLGLMFVI